jgi:hypothetical protein
MLFITVKSNPDNHTMAKILKSLIVVFILLIVVLAGIIYAIDVNQYKDEIISLVEENTGRDFTIDGDLEFAVSLIPKIGVEGVRLGNTDWGSNPVMARVGRFEAEISLLPLLRGNIQINRLILNDSEILLETDAEGNGNWLFSGSMQTETGAGSTNGDDASGLPPLNISEIRISGVTLTYRDGVTGEASVVVLDEISSSTGSFSEPTSLEARATYNAIPVSITATLGSLENLMANREYPVDIQAGLGEAEMGVSGKIMQPMQGSGVDVVVSFDVARLSLLNKLAKTELPDFGPVHFSGRIMPEGKLIRITEIQAQAGRSDLNGTITLHNEGPRPLLVADLHSRLIDLEPFSGDDETRDKTAPKKAKVFSDEPLPLESLASADAEIRLVIDRLQSSDVVLESTVLPLTLKNQRLAITTLKSGITGGSMTLDLILDAGKTPATITTDINISKLELGKLPKLEKDQSITGGITDIRISTRSSGNSVAAIMASMNGMILVDVGNGTMSNKKIDLVGADLITEAFSMLNPLAKKEDTSQLECAAVNINIKEGMALIDKGIALQTSKMYIVGDGKINLKTEALDMSIRPHSRQGIGIGGGALASLVKFGGTLANPKPVADAGAVLQAGVSVVSTGTAIASKGLSTLTGGQSGDAAAPLNPCDVALGRAAPATAAPASEPASDSTTVGDTVKGATDKVKGVLKGLFGGG